MQLKKYSYRFITLFLILIFFLTVFVVKLILIQVFQSEHLADLAQKQQRHLVEIEPVRGTIYDRNLRPLAFNVTVYSLYANPKMMKQTDKEQALKELPVLLNMDPELIRERLAKDKYFVWIQRKLPMEVSEKIKTLNIHGLGFRKESKRHYPHGILASHVIGFAGIDNKGLEGLELFYDKILKGKSGQMRILQDAKHRKLMLEDLFIKQRNGYHLVLTIDETIQFITEKALSEGMEKSHAKAASMIVLDIRTGEILALANRPTYDLTDIAKSSTASRTNRAVSYMYEPGSVFKIVTATAALEDDVFVENDEVFCENGEYRVANHILHDHTSHGKLTFQEVFELSSNIGVTKIAQELGPARIYKYAKRFHFGQLTDIDLKGEVKGVLKDPSVWSKTTISAIPIGQEVTVTPLQLVCALASIANDGLYMHPFLVKYIKDDQNQIIKSFRPKIVDRVMSMQTAHRVRDILVGVVERGTGKRARIKGIKVAGKTGTAQKVVNGTYSHSDFYATFMGFAPADKPRLAAVVVFDEPHPSYFGGTVSAPVFKEVIESSLKYLEISE